MGNKCVLIFMKILVTKAVSEDTKKENLKTCHLKIIHTYNVCLSEFSYIYFKLFSVLSLS